MEWTSLTVAAIASAIGLAAALRARRGGAGGASSRWGVAAVLAGVAITALAFGAARGWAREEADRRLRRETEDLARDLGVAFELSRQVARLAATAVSEELAPSRERLAELSRGAAGGSSGIVALLLLVPGQPGPAPGFALEEPLLRSFLEQAVRSNAVRVSPLVADTGGRRRVLVAARAGDDPTGLPRLAVVVVDPEAVARSVIAQHPRSIGCRVEATGPRGAEAVYADGARPAAPAVEHAAAVETGGHPLRVVAWSRPTPRADLVSLGPVLVLQLGVALALLVGWFLDGAQRRQRTLREVADRRGRELAESERTLASIVEAAPEAILVVASEDGVVLDANPFAGAWLGRARDRLIGTSLADLLAATPAQASEGAIRALLAPEPAGQRQITFRHASGRSLEGEASVARTTVHGRAASILLVRDVSALEHARRAAEASSEAKNLFLANVSHEIRTPLNGVLGMTELTLEHELTPAVREQVETINRCARDLLQVVDDVLDFSRLEAGQLELSPVPTDIGALVHDVASHLAPRARARGLTVATVVRRDLPRPLMLDAGRVRRILEHLVGNAIKFTPAGDVEISAQPGATQPDGRFELELAVRDTGPGIPREWRDEIFQPFRQADASHARPQGGTGIGLALSRQIAGALRGRLEVDSSPGEGATFRFRLTVAPAPGAMTPAPCALLVGQTAVVVHPSAGVRASLAEALLTLGMRARVAERPAEAARAAFDARRDGNLFAVVLIDDALLADPEVRARCAGWLGGGDAPTRVIPILTAPPTQTSVGTPPPLVVPFSSAELGARMLAALAPPGEAPVAERRREGPVLVVEDNPVNRRLVTTILERAGYRVVAADNGAEALARLAEAEPSLILMDVQMPVMDGLEATVRLRREPRWAALPVVALTAHAQASDREACLAAGMNDYLTKPIERGALLAAVARWTDAGPTVAASMLARTS
ncbi:MAG: response regulator [Acidobacteria bacterium]|nr:response regulator [Acidobacteriota bacterium]